MEHIRPGVNQSCNVTPKRSITLINVPYSLKSSLGLSKQEGLGRNSRASPSGMGTLRLRFELLRRFCTDLFLSKARGKLQMGSV